MNPHSALGADDGPYATGYATCCANGGGAYCGAGGIGAYAGARGIGRGGFGWKNGCTKRAGAGIRSVTPQREHIVAPS